jgi:protein phosphatase
MIFIEQITCLNELGWRENLEDTIYPPPGEATSNNNLFLVCDGVGGESKGEIASLIATREFAKYFDETPPEKNFIADDYLGQAQQHVLMEMRKYADIHPEALRMSTTLTLAYVNVKGVLAAWCGDSRIYHIRKGQIVWRSADHSLVAKLVEDGELTHEEAKNHPQRNVITRSLTASGKISDIDSKWLTDIQNDDYIMLCTDGVMEQISEPILEEIMSDPNEDKKSLFLKYSLGKTNDNFSLYLLKFSNTNAVTTKKRTKKGGFLLLWIIAVLLISAACGYAWITYFNHGINPFFSKKPKQSDTSETIIKKKKSSEAVLPELQKPDVIKNGQHKK